MKCITNDVDRFYLGKDNRFVGKDTVIDLPEEEYKLQLKTGTVRPFIEEIKILPSEGIVDSDMQNMKEKTVFFDKLKESEGKNIALQRELEERKSNENLLKNDLDLLRSQVESLTKLLEKKAEVPVVEIPDDEEKESDTEEENPSIPDESPKQNYKPTVIGKGVEKKLPVIKGRKI